MPVQRLYLNDEARDLIELTRELGREHLIPHADAVEAAGEFPADAWRRAGELGLMGLPWPEEHGGGGQPYETYLQAIEELSYAWMSIGVGVSIHNLCVLPLARYGTPEQQAALMPPMLDGSNVGAYCLSEPQAGSDVAAIRTRATRTADGYRLKGTKSWISHAGHAGFYTTFARTSDDGGKGLSCFVVPGDAPGLSFAAPERKMGLDGDTVREVTFEDVEIGADRLIGPEGKGLSIALAALDSGRLGISAAAVGLAQRALDVATDYAKERQQFGRSIGANQGLAWLLADMDAAVASARATYLHAARLRDAGLPHTKEASISKLVCSDMAMRVTTDAVQVLGGAGYTTDFPVERFMREAKITQIFEGTNQIQKLVISRHLLGR